MSDHHLQTHSTVRVRGMDTTRKSHQSELIDIPVASLLLLKNTILKKPDTVEAGKKTMVKAAIDFIEALSILVSCAIAVLSSVSCCVTRW